MTILNILQLNYFLCCVNQICFQQVFLTTQGKNWAKLLYTGASPKTQTDTAEMEVKSSRIIANSMETSFPNTWAKYCSSPKQAAVVLLAPASAPISSSEIPKEYISPGWNWREKPSDRGLQLCGDLGQLRFQQDPSRRILITNTDDYLHLCKEHNSSLSFHWPQWSWANIIWTLDSLHSSGPWPCLSAGESFSPCLCWRKKGTKAGLLDCASTRAITPH